jgi:hypothetical protein
VEDIRSPEQILTGLLFGLLQKTREILGGLVGYGGFLRRKNSQTTYDCWNKQRVGSAR